MTASRHIVFLITDGINTLDLTGPLEAFAAVNAFSPGAYSWTIAGETAAPVRAATGLTVLVDCAIEDAPLADTLILPGGCGPRTLIPSQGLVAGLTQAGNNARRVASVCTGTFLLYRSGLADRHRVATHWNHLSELAAACPGLSIDPDGLFVRDGKVWSSAGITAGIDMAMAMIAEDMGDTIAAAVARELVVYLRRPGSQAQFSEPLRAQNIDAGRLGSVIAWIGANLSCPLDNETLAARAGMSLRHFTRIFRETMGVSPAHYVERMRLDAARVMLGNGEGRISQVASAVGFATADSFRRAFERRFGIAPSAWRDQFSPGPAD
ncbi:GlxA family transcriptional regulator [Parvularcula flava]|uniref:Transcriptional regulator n=1 Tax=Aquisalinus luteolus TaxID=1566827 RepID=A0A8J3A652_9PROT|nr:GlxA family transcriptional regulator [Aquisalinus luteolus]NHK29613.1 GlxA family transcriptional regulator [Aquisalinus luteolus]GGI01408.1 transcriptional regulator [Aquisalinus luteolus]